MSHLRTTFTLILMAAVLTAAGCLLSAAAAGAAGRPLPRNCDSTGLRYPFMPGGPKTFGVFRLRVADGSCANAHRVARDWMARYEATVRAGRVRVPRSVDGFTFATLPADVAQTYRERGRMSDTTIWFDYQIPNG